MKDSSASTGARAAGLNDRLLRRLNEPVGVIDVRYAQRKYERLSEWLDKRLALLYLLQSRYADNVAESPSPLLMQRPFEAPVNFYSTVQSFPTAGQSLSTAAQTVRALSASEQTAARDEFAETFSPSLTTRFAAEEIAKARTEARPVADASPPPEGPLRVSRRRAPFNPNPVQAARPPAQPSPTDGPTGPERVLVEPSGSERSAEGEHEQSRSSSAGSRPDNPPVAAAERSPTALADRATSSLLPLAEPQAAAMVFERERQAAQPGPRAAAASDDAKASEPVARADSSSRSRQAAAVEILPAAKTGEAANSSLPLPEPRAVMQTAERQERAARESEQPAASQTTERRAAASTEREAVVAAEMTDGPSAQNRSEIVWRESSGHAAERESASRGPVRNRTSVAPQAETLSDTSSSQPVARQSAPAETQQQRREIGIEQLSPQVMRAISEKVMRAISLDLSVELERRGLKKWP